MSTSLPQATAHDKRKGEASGGNPPATAAFRPVVVAPTYNNERTLTGILERIEEQGIAVIVVNDGSTDGTAKSLAQWASSDRAASVTVLAHPVNRGKARALRTGFLAARRAGYTHVLTIDTDGQLAPEQIPEMLAAARNAPDALILGSRVDPGAGAPDACPAQNRFAWYLTALGIWLETGLRFHDSQCGLRVYPLRLLDTVRCVARRYGFESEIVTRAAWAGCRFRELPVQCRYFAADHRVSHFRAWRDGPSCFLMHAGLTIRRLIPWPSPRLDGRCKISRVRAAGGLGRALWRWVNPLELRRELHGDRLSQLILAGSFGIGVYMASVPLAGFQILLAVYASWRLHIHLLPVLVGLLVMLPPCGAILAKMAIWLGYALLHAQPPDPVLHDPLQVGHWTVLGRIPIAWFVGSTLVGFVTNWVTIGLGVLLFRAVSAQEPVDGQADDEFGSWG